MDQRGETKHDPAIAFAQDETSAYQLTLAGLLLPVPIHVAFNAVAALCGCLLGHPGIAIACFAGSSAFDTLYQMILKHWSGSAAETPQEVGFRRLALLNVSRASTYMVPPVLMAWQGGLAELAYFCVTACTLAALAFAGGSLSRLAFWSMAGPPLLISATAAVITLPLQDAAAILLGLLCTTALFALISQGTTSAVTTWHKAFNANRALISELEVTRDRAVAERTAADEAREEARRANRAKSNFLATMSHEIRTPMNGVMGMAQLLRREEADPLQAARLETLIDSGEYLLSILNDILDVSKIDAGRLEITPQVEDLPEFLNRLVAFWGARADEKGVALKLEVDDDLPHFVWMDPLRLRQVLFNLISNALKFTDTGSVRIVVKARPKGESAVTVHVAVVDTGPGISTEHHPMLFERFSQADDSGERKFGGTGLGLAIAKQMIELMDGQIWVDSEPGQGSTFHVEAPFDLAQGGTGSADDVEDEGEVVTDLDVLIVDDNAVNLLVLEQILSTFGHRVEKAADGASALDLLQARPFDLVLMDIQMPGMTGTEALGRLREGPGPNQDVVVVALTADVTSGGRPHYLSLGFSDHCSKPIQIPDLMAAIGRAMTASPADSRRETGSAAA